MTPIRRYFSNQSASQLKQNYTRRRWHIVNPFLIFEPRLKPMDINYGGAEKTKDIKVGIFLIITLLHNCRSRATSWRKAPAAVPDMAVTHTPQTSPESHRRRHRHPSRRPKTTPQNCKSHLPTPISYNNMVISILANFVH